MVGEIIVKPVHECRSESGFFARVPVGMQTASTASQGGRESARAATLPLRSDEARRGEMRHEIGREG